MAKLGYEPGPLRFEFLLFITCFFGEPSITETEGDRGKWVPLTFLVFPRALCEEQLILAIWEVGWKKLIHEGAGKKDKAGRQTEPLWAITALNSPPLTSTYGCSPQSPFIRAPAGHVIVPILDVESLRGWPDQGHIGNQNLSCDSN